MNAPTLFDLEATAAVRWTDPVQSVRAALKASQRRPSRRKRILEALAVRAMTDDELCEALGEEPRWWPSVKSARSGLKHDNKVVGTGLERRGQQVWSLPPEVRNVKLTTDIL